MVSNFYYIILCLTSLRDLSKWEVITSQTKEEANELLLTKYITVVGAIASAVMMAGYFKSQGWWFLAKLSWPIRNCSQRVLFLLKSCQSFKTANLPDWVGFSFYDGAGWDHNVPHLALSRLLWQTGAECLWEYFFILPLSTGNTLYC